MQPLIAIQEQLVAECGKAKREFDPPAKDEALAAKLSDLAAERISQALVIPDKMERYGAMRQLERDTSDGDGRFAIGSLHPDMGYILRASKPGFATGEHHPHLDRSHRASDSDRIPPGYLIQP